MATWLLILTASGMLGVLAMCRPDQVAWKYVRVVAAITLALLVGGGAWLVGTADSPLTQTTGVKGSEVGRYGAATAGSPEAWSAVAKWCALAAAVPVVGLVALAPLLAGRRKLFAAMTGAPAAIALVAACAWTRAWAFTEPPSAGQWAALLVVQLLSALLLGSVTDAWLLGHAYLTATRMTIAPLHRLARILMAAVALRCAVSLATMAVIGKGLDGMVQAGRLGGVWIIVGLRAGIGLVLPAVFAYMVADCVRLRSTQSATGILYFTSLFVYVGELAGQYLLGELGWPV